VSSSAPHNDVRHHEIETDDATVLHAWSVGPSAGAPVVLVAGAGTDHRGWRSVVPELCASDAERALWAPLGRSLAANAHVVVFDQRATGLTGEAAPATRAETTASDAVAVGRQVLGERFCVVGESMGGMAALHAALGWPEVVTRLGLVSTTAGGAGLTWPTPAFVARGPDFRGDTVSQARAGIEPSVAREFPARQPERLEAMVADAVSAGSSDDARAAMAEVFMHHDVAARLAEIGVPTLVICGDEDQAHPLPNSAFLAAHIPDARLVVVSGVGHLLAIEAPETLVAEIDSFLTS
jgi:3-oxoadipate enol-lactonase